MFKVQVKVRAYQAGDFLWVWKDVRPSHGPAYEYRTREAARLACEHMNDGSRTWDDFRIIDMEASQ